MTVSEVKKIIEFSRDWNNGMSVEDMASKYAIKPMSVRSRVASLRKQGVKLASRKRGIGKLEEKEVVEINKAL